jgi:hypothetical protein
MVVREPDASLYRPGPAVLTLRNVYLDTPELRWTVIPWAEDLAGRIGYAVQTGVMLLERRGRGEPPAPAGRVAADAGGRDRRRPRGVRNSLPGLPAVAIAAVVSGAGPAPTRSGSAARPRIAG